MAGVQHLELADLQGPHTLQKGIVIFSLYSKQHCLTMQLDILEELKEKKISLPFFSPFKT